MLCIMFIVECLLREVDAEVLYAERLARSGDKKLRCGGGAWLVAQLTKALSRRLLLLLVLNRYESPSIVQRKLLSITEASDCLLV